MNQQEIMARSWENEAALRSRGVVHAALFGSRACGDDRPDTDTLVQIDPDARVGVYKHGGIKTAIATLLDGPVDRVTRDGLRPYMWPAAKTDAIHAV